MKKEDRSFNREAGKQPPLRHYSREERLSLASAPRRRDAGGRGLFRRNRTLLIILLDLIIISILGIFLVRFLYSQASRAEIAGYSFVMRGFRSGDVVVAVLSIKPEAGEVRASAQRKRATAEQKRANAEQKRANAGPDARIYVRFSLQRNFEAKQLTFASVAAPEAEEGEVILRTTVPANSESEVLYAEVRIGDTVKRLSCGIEE
jgi:hypothetical protein